MQRIFLIITTIFIFVTIEVNAQLLDSYDLYNLDTKLESRSISFENPTGEKGKGGMAESHLGVGRKGSPNKTIKSGEVITLCDIKGPGTIRHIWMGGTFQNLRWITDSTRFKLLRSTVVRAYWDNQTSPSIECPLGDFMGFAHAQIKAYNSIAHSIADTGSLNLWLPMPFVERAVITLTNESEKPFDLYYTINYTINDEHPTDVGRLHVCFRRENPTTLKKDFEILPKRTGKGRYLGTVIGVRVDPKYWWGEGEIKIYMDGDKNYPTICGDGTEDYFGQAYGMKETTHLYLGCSYSYRDNKKNNQYLSMYRWHVVDPIYWKKDCRITFQQIGFNTEIPGFLFERQDDWSAATFWYEPVPSSQLPPFPSIGERVKDLPE